MLPMGLNPSDILEDCLVYYSFSSQDNASILQSNVRDVSIAVFFTFYCCGFQSETHLSMGRQREKT